MRKIVLFICASFLFQSCKLNSNNPPDSTKPLPDVLAVNMDTTIKQAEDFFMYANGGWIKNNAIPAECSRQIQG